MRLSTESKFRCFWICRCTKCTTVWVCAPLRRLRSQCPLISSLTAAVTWSEDAFCSARFRAILLASLIRGLFSTKASPSWALWKAACAVLTFLSLSARPLARGFKWSKSIKVFKGFYLSLHNSLTNLTLFFCCFCVERLEPIRFDSSNFDMHCWCEWFPLKQMYLIASHSKWANFLCLIKKSWYWIIHWYLPHAKTNKLFEESRLWLLTSTSWKMTLYKRNLWPIDTTILHCNSKYLSPNGNQRRSILEAKRLQ